ncbi:integrase [Clostridium beijerinckii]|uniref:Integrase n=1 Tax=Clostridium beijerinckii TaxID=1520 RepID=A0A0B5QC86_CLOBE|nr:tyrosine-type recombinase/integrase [Clostridium beijerinckii]AJG98555.1 integrase [Clostridium beijerinckii]
MGELKQIDEKKRYEFFYLVGNRPINNEMKYHICIFEKSRYQVHLFSRYLTDKMGNFSLKNKALNTIIHFHLTYIIRFLNFIFNDSKTTIDNIEDLTLDMVEEFLDNYAQGTLPNDVHGDWKSKDSVNRATYAISHFVYWLWWKKEAGSYKKMFKMKYLKEHDFEFETETKRGKNGYTSRQIKVLSDLVIPNMSSKKRIREKVVGLSSYGVSKLIEISQSDQMLTFGIVLGAYAGLRLGDIVQMHEGRIKGLDKDKDFGGYFDLTYDTILRSDNIITGNIKTKRKVPIYAGCTRAIYMYYQNHLEYLKYKKLYPNMYGALFIDNKGHAMTGKTFSRRFDELIKQLEKIVKKEAMLGSRKAVQEDQILSEAKVTPHSLRYYFKQLIETVENGNERKIQYYMAHKSIGTQHSYGVAQATSEAIRKCQNELYMTIKQS